VVEGQGCTYTASDGSKYDLSQMAQASGGQDYYGTDAKGYQYYWNICGNTVSTQCGVPSSVCQTATGRMYSCGMLPPRFSDNADGPVNEGVTLVYSNGSTAAGCFPRSTIINLKCNPNVGRGNVVSIKEGTTQCSYVISMESAYACPKGSSPSSCTYTATDGSKYDLSQMTAQPGGNDYTWKDSRFNYIVNICGPVVSTASCGKPSSTVCQFPGPQCCGTISPMSFQDGEKGPRTGVTITYGGGDTSTCPAGASRQTVVYVTCNPTAGKGIITTVTESPACLYKVWMESQYACPQGSPPPPNGNLCCLYSQVANNGTRAICTSNAQCPDLTGFTKLGYWAVKACTDCAFDISKKYGK